MKLGLLLITLLGLSIAQADGYGPDARVFKSEIKAFVSACPKIPCEAAKKTKEIFVRGQEPMAPRALLVRFEQIAWDQAQIWGDTILEGDYHADGKTRLDSVIELYSEDELVGYKITYSEGAWDTSTCSYNGQNDQALANCTAGRIVESSFVSPDFRTYLADQNQFAEFIPNN